MKRVLIALFVVTLVLGCSACSGIGSSTAVHSSSTSWDAIKGGALLVDVRGPQEYASGSIDGSVNIPHDEIRSTADELGSDKSRQVVVYCRSGRRAGLAMKALKDLGFDNVINAGGYSDLLQSRPKP